LLTVYVDDFKLAAKAELHEQLWKDIKSVIDMEDETADNVLVRTWLLSDPSWKYLSTILGNLWASLAAPSAH
jgi:hypothetical protein